MVLIDKINPKFSGYSEMMAFANDVHRQVQERFDEEIEMVVTGEPWLFSLIRFELVDSDDGQKFKILLTLYPAGFSVRFEEVLGYKAAVILRIAALIEYFQKKYRLPE